MANQHINGIHFNFLADPFYLPRRTDLKDFIHQIFIEEKRKVKSVNYIFCSDKYLFELNKKYLKHNTYTDIITFQYSEPLQPIYSDIYISIERVKENAEIYNNSFLSELYRVIFHGALHLIGYQDKKKEDLLLMRKKEDFYLKQYVSREKKGKD